MPTDPRGAWFAWRRNHLEATELEAYEWGVKIGQRLAIERTARWAGLVPLLQDVLWYLVDNAVERDMEATLPLTGVDGSDHGGGPATRVEPDLTVGQRGVQEWAC